eukprot:jgi/Botrbrau1/12807/Bobra.117_1s0023.1
MAEPGVLSKPFEKVPLGPSEGNSHGWPFKGSISYCTWAHMPVRMCTAGGAKFQSFSESCSMYGGKCKKAIHMVATAQKVLWQVPIYRGKGKKIIHMVAIATGSYFTDGSVARPNHELANSSQHWLHTSISI